MLKYSKTPTIQIAETFQNDLRLSKSLVIQIALRQKRKSKMYYESQNNDSVHVRYYPSLREARVGAMQQCVDELSLRWYSFKSLRCFVCDCVRRSPWLLIENMLCYP